MLAKRADILEQVALSCTHWLHCKKTEIVAHVEWNADCWFASFLSSTDAYLHLNRLGNDTEPLPGQV